MRQISRLKDSFLFHAYVLYTVNDEDRSGRHELSYVPRYNIYCLQPHSIMWNLGISDPRIILHLSFSLRPLLNPGLDHVRFRVFIG